MPVESKITDAMQDSRRGATGARLLGTILWPEARSAPVHLNLTPISLPQVGAEWRQVREETLIGTHGLCVHQGMTG